MKKCSKMQLRRVVVAMLATFVVTASLSGCGSNDKNKEADEKNMIKVQYLCGRMNLELESVLEDNFPTATQNL